MARRAISLSSSPCIPTIALALAATFVLTTTHQARADAGIKKSGVCRYDSPDGIAAFKKRAYRQAAELFTKAIDWIEQNCKGAGSSQVDLLNNSKSGLWDAYKSRAASYTGLKDYGKAVHDLVTMDQASFVGFSKSELKTTFLAYDGAVKSDPNNPFYRGGRATRQACGRRRRLGQNGQGSQNVSLEVLMARAGARPVRDLPAQLSTSAPP